MRAGLGTRIPGTLGNEHPYPGQHPAPPGRQSSHTPPFGRCLSSLAAWEPGTLASEFSQRSSCKGKQLAVRVTPFSYIQSLTTHSTQTSFLSPLQRAPLSAISLTYVVTRFARSITTAVTWTDPASNQILCPRSVVACSACIQACANSPASHSATVPNNPHPNICHRHEYHDLILSPVRRVNYFPAALTARCLRVSTLCAW